MPKVLDGHVHEDTFFTFQFHSSLSQRSEGVSHNLKVILIIYSFQSNIVEVRLHSFNWL